MKSILSSLRILLVFLLAAVPLHAQIASVEYFYDTDPGFGNGIPLTGFTAGNSINFNASIPVNNLSGGFHQLYVRSKTAAGMWSHYKSQLLFVTAFSTGNGDITGAEYFFDTDPGLGHGQAIAFTPTASITQNISIPVTGLSAGFHQLFIRTKNTSSFWSHYQTRAIYVGTVSAGNGNIAGAEYFFDVDPGVGHGSAIPLNNGAVVTQTITIPVGNLSPGFHELFLRTRTTGNTWSHDQGRPFFVAAIAGGARKIAAAEYFIDTDPGNGNGTVIPINPPVDTASQLLTMAIPGNIAAGEHHVFIRVKNESGQWSLYQTSVFAVKPKQPGSGYALSFDGGNDYLTMPTTGYTGIGNYTIECWIKKNAANANSHVWESNGGSAPSLESNGGSDLKFWVGNTSSLSTGALDIDKWYHVACVYDSANTLQSLYVNGILTGSNTVSVSDVLGANIGFMSRNVYSGNTRNFNGNIDEIRIWHTALTQAQIRDRMCHKITAIDALYSKLVAYYNLDENFGTATYDDKGANAGALVNGPNWVTSGAPIGNISAHNYSGAVAAASITNPTRNDMMTATLTAGGADGIQVYCVTDTPNNVAGTTCLSNNAGYFGAFAVNGTSTTYDAVYNYSGVNLNGISEAQIRLYKRFDNASPLWADANGVLDSVNNTVTAPDTSRSEYIVSNSVVTPFIAISANVSGPVCPGTAVVFSSTITNGGTAPAYQWRINNVAVPGATNASFTTNLLANNDSVSCRLTSNSSCAITSFVVSNQLHFTVTPGLTASVSIAAVPGHTICAGTYVTYTATPVNGGSSPVYQWKINGVPMGGNANTYTGSGFADHDIVTVEMSTNATCASPATVASIADTMHVTPVAVPTIITTANPGNVICEGTAVSFNAAITNGGTAAAYQWKKNGNNVGSNAAVYADSFLHQNDVIVCELTSNASCATPATVASAAVTMTVNSTAPPTLTISNNTGNTICANAPVTFTASNITNGGVVPTYQWTRNGLNIPGATAATYFTDSLINADAIACRIVSSQTCASPANATSAAIVMTVNPFVVPTIFIASNISDTICNGTTVTFTASITNGGNSPIYQWQKNHVNVGSNSSSYIDNSLMDGDSISCQLTSNYACASIANVASNGKRITVRPLPVANAGADQTILQGSSVVLTATGGGTYSWSNNDTTATTVVAPINTTDYVVTVANNYGCTAKDTVRVNVNFSSISVTPANYNFGNVVLNTAVPTNIVITNNGTLAVNLNSASVGGPFAISFNAQSLAPNASITIPVTFTPTATLIYQNTMAIGTSIGSFSVVLQGRGVSAAPAWSISSSLYDFGNTQLNDSSFHSFFVVNTGNVPITISGITSSSPVFAGSAAVTTIPVNGQATMTVRFKPTALTTYAGTISINSSTPGLPALATNVTGNGYIPATPPTLQFVSAAPFNSASGVDLPVALAGLFTYRVLYKSAAGKAPQAGYPKVGIDLNADHDFLDAGEGIYAMSQVGAGTDWVNGEVFTYTQSLPIGNSYGYQFFGKDSLGNIAASINTNYVNGPLVTNQALDLSIYANDITFSNNHPAVNQQFTVSAVIHNNSPYSASNVPVRFYKDSVYLVSSSVPFIAANSSVTITQNFSFGPDGFYPIKVWIDSAHTLTAENNVLNNYAIRPVIVGNFSIPGTILVTKNAATQSCGTFVSISGNAVYDGLNLVGNPPVLGATVTVAITGGPTLTTNTVTGGYWNVSWSNFSCGQTFSYTVSVTDYTLTSNPASGTFNALCQSCGSSVYYAPDHSSGTGSCLRENQSFLYDITTTNPCNADTLRNDTTFVYVNAVLAYTHVHATVNPCAVLQYHDAFTLAAGTQVLSYKHVYYDSLGRHTYNGSNTVNIELNLPDLYLGNFSQTASTAFSVQDIDPTCIGASAHKVFLYDSVANTPRVLLDSFAVSGINASSFQTLNYSKPNWQMGYHFLRLITDALNDVTERNEINNVLEAVLYVPFPELTISDIVMSSSAVSQGSIVNFSAQVHNTGSTAGAFKVQFLVAGVPVGNKILISSLAANGSTQVVSDQYTIPANACPLVVTAIADVDSQVTEFNEGNNYAFMDLASDLVSGIGCNGVGSSCNPYVVVKNFNYRFNSSVSNTGTRDVSNVAVKFSLNGLKIGEDNIASIVAQNSAATGLYHTFTNSGSYVITVFPDSANAICELNENNNLGAIYINVVEGQPDLEILSQHISPSNLNPNPNQTMNVVASIFNKGNQTSAPCKVRFYLDNVQLGADVTIDSIQPGLDTTVAATVTFSSPTVGPKIIKVKADVLNEIAEIREDNNEATRAIIVGGAPDLAHSLHEAITFTPASFRRNETVQISNYIRNYGGDHGTAWLKYFITDSTGVKTLLDSVQFTLLSNDSMKVTKAWTVNVNGPGLVTTEIAHSNPQEYNEFNNVDSLAFIAGPVLALQQPVLTDSVLCDNTHLHINSSIAKAGQAVAFEWYRNGIPTGNTTQDSFVIAHISLTDSGSYTLHATDYFGSKISPAKKVIVKPNLVPGITITANPGNVICAGTNVKFSAATTNAGAGYSLQWMKNNLPVGDPKNQYLDTAMMNGDGIICKVAATEQCISSLPVASNAINMTVNPLSGGLAGSSASQSNDNDSGMKFNYTDNGCSLIATVATDSNIDLGMTTATTTIDPSLTGFVKRYVEITPTNNLRAYIRLYFLQSEFDTYNQSATANSLPLLPSGPNSPDTSHIVIYQYHGLPSGGTTGPGGHYDAGNVTVIQDHAITKHWNATTHYWEIGFPVTSFSGHFLKAENNVALPIRLGSISAVNNGSTNRVNWETLVETPGSYFELERSADGSNFMKIATINSSGNAASYLYNDEHPVAGINYYRLRLYEANGKYQLSKTVSALVKDGAFGIEVFPNPAKNRLTVHSYGTSGSGKVVLTDIAGSTLRSIDITRNEAIFDITSLAQGIYFVKYTDDSGNLLTVRVVKE